MLRTGKGARDDVRDDADAVLADACFDCDQRADIHYHEYSSLAEKLGASVFRHFRRLLPCELSNLRGAGPGVVIRAASGIRAGVACVNGLFRNLDHLLEEVGDNAGLSAGKSRVAVLLGLRLTAGSFFNPYESTNFYENTKF